MKINPLKYIITFFLILGTFFSYNAFAVQRKIVLAADYWCPYNCEPGSEQEGYLVELARSAFAIYGIEVEYKLLPWSVALEQARQGKIDGVIGISDIEGEGLLATRVPQLFSDMGVFIRNDSEWVYDGTDSILGKRVSIILDYNVGSIMKEYVSTNYPKNPGLFTLESGERAVSDSIMDLINNQSDIFIEDEKVVNYYLHHNNLHDKIKNVGRINDKPLPIYVAFSTESKPSATYVKMLEDGIASLTGTGDVAELKAKYHLK